MGGECGELADASMAATTVTRAKILAASVVTRL